MPSAEKVASAAAAKASDALPPSDSVEKELDQNSEKAQSPIQQVMSIISNKIRNLEKRKVCNLSNFDVLQVIFLWKTRKKLKFVFFAIWLLSYRT